MPRCCEHGNETSAFFCLAPESLMTGCAILKDSCNSVQRVINWHKAFA